MPDCKLIGVCPALPRRPGLLVSTMPARRCGLVGHQRPPLSRPALRRTMPPAHIGTASGGNSPVSSPLTPLAVPLWADPLHHLAPAPAVARAAQPAPPERHGG